MSTMVVTDVTSAVSGVGATILPRTDTFDDTSITSFKTVLDQATSAKKTELSSDVKEAPVAKMAAAVKAVGDNETSATGTTKLENIFKRASEKYDISYDFLVAVAKAESDFDYECVSSAGAKGIMQLMPDEVKEFGVTDVFNPEQNIMAAAKLLAAHLKKFKGDFTLAAAAYNAGSGAVQKYGGVPPYNETQNYVKKIARFMKEGVKVPDKDAPASIDYSAYEGKNYAGTTPVTGSGTTGTSSEPFDQGVMATDEDWDQVRVTVGTGDQAVTMTYGAYMKYKELGSLGVG